MSFFDSLAFAGNNGRLMEFWDFFEVSFALTKYKEKLSSDQRPGPYKQGLKTNLIVFIKHRIEEINSEVGDASNCTLNIQGRQ